MMSDMTEPEFHILVALAGGDLHGYAIMQEIAGRTGGRLRMRAGTLYGCIHRMLERGLVVELPEDERRRYYRLTAAGRRAAKAEAARLAEMVEQAREHGLAPKRG